MKDIKTRDHIKTIRTLDKAAVAGEKMKNVSVRMKDTTVSRSQDDADSSSEYSSQEANRISGGVAHDAKQTLISAQKRAKSASSRKKAPSHDRDERGRKKAKGAIKQKQNQVHPRTRTNASSRVRTKTNRIKTPTSSKSAAQAKAAAQKKQAAVTAQRSAAKARYVANTTAKAVKKGAKAAGAAAKKIAALIIEKTEALIAAIAAGGSTAALVIILICMVGLIVGSAFGILFSGEDTGSGQTLRDAISEINQEYEAQLDSIRANNAHDVVEMSGSRAVWRDVLSVYAVRTTTDPDNPQEVVSMDDNKKQLLRDIFWEMNTISYHTETVTRDVVTETADDEGNITTETQQQEQTVLYIVVKHKTPEEMAASYSFNANQNSQLTELLSPEYATLWNTALYGITASDTAIVDVARSQIGNVGGQPYWSWYGFNTRVAWCACFVSWCSNECGYIDNGIIPKYSYCPTGADWFKQHGQWAERDITPEPGMIIFFDWASRGGQDGVTDHTGIVEKVEDGRVYTIEGNSGNACREKSYPIGWYEIYGYGIPQF